MSVVVASVTLTPALNPVNVGVSDTFTVMATNTAGGPVQFAPALLFRNGVLSQSGMTSATGIAVFTVVENVPGTYQYQADVSVVAGPPPPPILPPPPPPPIIPPPPPPIIPPPPPPIPRPPPPPPPQQPPNQNVTLAIVVGAVAILAAGWLAFSNQ